MLARGHITRKALDAGSAPAGKASPSAIIVGPAHAAARDSAGARSAGAGAKAVATAADPARRRTRDECIVCWLRCRSCARLVSYPLLWSRAFPSACIALGVTEQTPEAHRAPKDSPKVHRTLENAGCSRSGGTAMAENGSRGSPGRRGLKDMKPLPRLQFGEGVGTGGIRQSMDSVRSVHESLPGSPSMLSMRGCMAVSVSGIAPACRRVYRSACLQQYGAR